MPALSRVLFRSLMKMVDSLEGAPLRVRLPVQQSSAQWIRNSGPQSGFEQRDAGPDAFISMLFPQLRSRPWPSGSQEIEPQLLRQAIRDEFRRPSTAIGDTKPDTRVDAGFAALRALAQQMALTRRSSVCTTELPEESVACRVEASSAFLGREQGGHFVFQYASMHLRTICMHICSCILCLHAWMQYTGVCTYTLCALSVHVCADLHVGNAMHT